MVDADEIARLCYERFSELPRRGKPEPGREWTLLAAVVKVTRTSDTERGCISNAYIGAATLLMLYKNCLLLFFFNDVTLAINLGLFLFNGVVKLTSRV